MHDLGFDLLILCAEELQTPSHRFPGVHVYFSPLDDHPAGLTEQERKRAWKAARAVADAVVSGKQTLVTCAMGRNRSGYVTAVALWMLTGMAGSDVVALIQDARPESLSNKAFVRDLARLPNQAFGRTHTAP